MSTQVEASYELLTSDDVAVASQRPPVFDLAALASVAGMRDSRGCVPLDFCVPRKSEVAAPPGLDLSTLLVLAHVDGSASLRDIAERTRLALPRTIEAYLELVALGVLDPVE
jgi:hypothetical protein